MRLGFGAVQSRGTKAWFVRSFGEKLRLSAASDDAPPALEEPAEGGGTDRTDDRAARSALTALVHASIDGRGARGAGADATARVLLEVYAAVGGPRVPGFAPWPARPPSLRGLDRRVRETLLRALDEGRLRLDVVPRCAWVLPDVAPEPEAAPQPVVDEQTTFIEIALVDQTGAPVPNRAYQVDVPGGGTRRGRLDAQGKARLEGLDPGNCKITFPSFEERDHAVPPPARGARRSLSEDAES